MTTESAWIEIDDSLRVPRAELTYRATRSGGPGGQHVNTSSTRVELTWNVATSPSLTEAQRTRLLERLRSRIDSEGTLRLTAARTRSQARNKDEVTERFRRLLAGALRERPVRKPTRPPQAADEARLRGKRRRGELKRSRRSGRERADDEE